MIKNIKEILILSTRLVIYNIKFVILFWFTNSIFAAVLSIPIYQLLLDSLRTSLISDKLAYVFDYFWFIQFLKLNETSLNQIPLAIYSIVVIYTIIQTFYLGGLISIFNQTKKNLFVDFFYGGVKYFGRFFKVLLASLIFYIVAFKINDILGDLISWFFKDSENTFAEFILRSLRYILLVFFIGIISLISDYSKVSLAIRDRSKVLSEIYFTINFIRNNFNIVFLVFLFIASLGALGVIIYNIVVFELPRTPYYFLVLSFILQQMLIIFRLLIRMLFCSSEVILYKDLSADIISTGESSIKNSLEDMNLKEE